MKILVTYATAGAGHKKCAEAIFNFLKSNTFHEAHIADCLDYTHPVFKFLYSGGYAFLVSRHPFLWYLLFRLTDNAAFSLVTRPLRRISNSLNAKRFIRYLLRERFDCCICTQFFANEIVSHLKAQGLIDSKLICVITDYSVHRFWLSERVDIYAVACREAMQRLLCWGVSEQKIRVTGIPVNLRFILQPDKEELASRLQLSTQPFTILVITGTFGIGPIQRIVERLQEKVQLLVVCGNNAGLFRRLNRIKNNSTKVYGLVANIDELMSISNLVITKPGGLTISEALVKHLPMLFISAIPGQEIENARLMVAYQVASLVDSVEGIVNTVDKLRSNPNALAYMQANTLRLGKPFAVREILKLVNE